MQCQERCLKCLMAICKKERPTIQQKEKLKNKHQNSLLGGASNGKMHISKDACQFFSPVAPYTKDAI